MTNMLRLENVSHCYFTHNQTKIVALSQINLEIPKGEFLSIIGPNASGKTTLAKLLNALLIPLEGNVWVEDMDTREENYLWDIRQKVGLVFSNPDNQIVGTTVEEDIAFGLENLGIPAAEMRVRVKEALKTVEMEDYAKSAPHLLSGGQKQRVAIAGVIAMRPACIVLDEPTDLLDPQGRIEVMQTVKRLNQEGATIIYITHFMEEAVEAERLIVLHRGRIVLMGKPRAVFQEVDFLQNLGLDVPEVSLLVQNLRREGLKLPPEILTQQELINSLKFLRQEKVTVGK